MKIWILLLCAAVFSMDEYNPYDVKSTDVVDSEENRPWSLVKKTMKCVLGVGIFVGIVYKCCSYYNQQKLIQMPLQHACNEVPINTVLEMLQKNVLKNGTSKNFFTVGGVCIAANSAAITGELNRQCRMLVNSSTKLFEWWNSKACTGIKYQNVASQCEQKHHFPERLPFKIETVVSGFFSNEIYRFFGDQTAKHNYKKINEKLGRKLEGVLSRMKGPKTLRVTVKTLKISSPKEKYRADWGVFNIDVTHGDRKHFQTVVAFKGTDPKQFKDIAADLNQKIIEDDVLPTHVPEGFHDSLSPVYNEHFMNAEEEIAILIAKDTSEQQRSIIISGHSLGGALAKLMGTRIKSSTFIETIENKIKCQTLKKAIKDAKIFTFGAPQIFQKDFVSTVLNDNTISSNFHHFIGEHDPVPRLQLSYYRPLWQIWDNWCFVKFRDFGEITVFAENKTAHYVEKISPDKLNEKSKKKWTVDLWNAGKHPMKNYINNLNKSNIMNLNIQN